jgi:hypothetical protein
MPDKKGTDTVTDYALNDAIEKIPGWLHKVTALRTIDILEWQRSNNITGDLLEIGVFCGRYFAILLDSALKQGDHVLGIDTFQFIPQERVNAELNNVFGGKEEGSYTLWTDQSSRIHPQTVLSKVKPLRFISIDGAHDYQNVYRDLVLCESLLSPDGIIAADDFLNPLAIGVNEAINKYLSEPRPVVPVAYIANKLFLAHRSRADDYRAAIEGIIMVSEGPQCDTFREKVAVARHQVEQEFHGNKMLLL